MKHVSFLAAVLLSAACHESFDERLVREAHDQTRRNCPRRIDRGIVLDSITYHPALQEWSYCYTLTDSLDSDEVFTDETLEIFHDHLLTSVTNDLNLRRLKERGITIVYSYRRASSGHEAIREVFTKEDY